MSRFQENHEWRKKSPSLWSAARSLVGQALQGIELSKISMPADYFYPYSALEVGPWRLISRPQLVFDIANAETPLERMKAILRWFFAGVPIQEYTKKPFNSILGEVHEARSTFLAKDGEKHTVSYLAEQVAHHPPVYAYVMQLDDGCRFRDEGHSQFEARMEGSNSLRLSVSGTHVMTFPDDKITFSRPAPDVSFVNMIIGTRHVRWDGDITISSESGWTASISFSHPKKPYENIISGELRHTSGEHYSLCGACGGTLYMGQEKIAEWKDLGPSSVLYASEDELDPLDSLSIWRNAADLIAADRIRDADKAKREVEEAQRHRRRTNSSHPVRFFEPDFGDAGPPPLSASSAETDDAVIAPRYRCISLERLVDDRSFSVRVEASYTEPTLLKQATMPITKQ